METIHIRLTLTDRDAYINKMEQQIKAKQQLLLNKYKDINNLAKDNSFLLNVKDDYANYYNFIIAEKNSQLIAMSKLTDYLKQVSNRTDLTVNKIQDAKFEQMRILNEMNIIKQQINNLIK